MSRSAVVFGAGGTAGIAWEIGVIAGFGDTGIDLRNADLFIGTSAGSVVAAQLLSGCGIDRLFQQQVDPQQQVKEPMPRVDFNRLKSDLASAKEGGGDITMMLQRIGALAVATKSVTEAERRAVIAARLSSHDWPAQRLCIATVDVASGERCVFDQSSGIDLVDAVAASCAVPGIWPPVTIGGRRYMDGGVYATENADLAEGCDRILILALTPRMPPIAAVPLDTAVKSLRESGAAVDVVHPDHATEAAFASVGGNLLDPSVRAIAARAGRMQGRSLAKQPPFA